MELPQIDAASCVILVTIILWIRTRLKLPIGCHFQEATVRRYNRYAHWGFSGLVGLELLTINLNSSAFSWLLGPATGLIFYFYAVASCYKDLGFWSKPRNQLLGLLPLLLCSLGLSLLIKDSYFVPLLGAFALAQVSHKKYLQMVYTSMQDLETLHAKVLKQEAANTNLRHFEQIQVRAASQKA